MHINPHFYRPRAAVSLRSFLALCGLGLCGIALLVMTVDIPVSAALSNHGRLDLPGDLKKAINLSEAFAHGSSVAVILGLILLIHTSARQKVLVAILITAGSGLAANGLKGSLPRVRPYARHQISVEGDVVFASLQHQKEVAATQKVTSSFWDARQRSFPSGHAATAWGLAIGLTLVFPRGVWAFGTLAICASLQRVVSEAHYPSDVVCGAAVALLVAALILSVPWCRRVLTEVAQGTQARSAT